MTDFDLIELLYGPVKRLALLLLGYWPDRLLVEQLPSGWTEGTLLILLDLSEVYKKPPLASLTNFQTSETLPERPVGLLGFLGRQRIYTVRSGWIKLSSRTTIGSTGLIVDDASDHCT